MPSQDLKLSALIRVYLPRSAVDLLIKDLWNKSTIFQGRSTFAAAGASVISKNNLIFDFVLNVVSNQTPQILRKSKAAKNY